MSNADSRTPSTDALDTLGMIHWKPEKRDAIHLAVEAVQASEPLKPGQRIGIVDGVAYPEGRMHFYPVKEEGHVEGVNRVGFVKKPVPYHGIVDPFLTTEVATGQRFWFVMKPREVRSLRHVWEHEDFPAGE